MRAPSKTLNDFSLTDPRVESVMLPIADGLDDLSEARERMTEPRADALPVEHAEVREGVDLAYVREGAGGYPLVLVHGWPETKRVWWRNVEPLARRASR